jgi:TonB-dependent receptor
MSTKHYALALISTVSALSLAHAACAADDAPKATDVKEVVVTGAPREEVKARKVQQDAINVIDVQSAETIAKYPDFNAAEALGRMPGVSMSVDTGEGRYINIRGIDGNLDGATFGGVPLLNDDPGGVNFGGGGRAVNFDTVPVGAVDGIILTKTLTPDHDAEGLGGTIELTPRTARDITKPFFDGTLGWGYENERDVTGPFDADIAAGARFGFINGKLAVEGVDDTAKGGGGAFSNPTPFSFVLTMSRKDDRRGFDDIEEDYNYPITDRSYNDLQFRRYNYHRRRFGMGFEFDFKPNEDHSWYLRANQAGYVEAVSKNRLTFDFSSYLPETPTAGGGFTSLADLSVKSTDEQETHRNQVYIIGGQDRFGDAVLDYHTSYSRATFYQGYDYGTTWNGPTVAAVYNNSQNNGDFPQIAVTDGTNINNGALYSLKKQEVTNQQQQDIDQEYTVAVNFQFPAHLYGDDSVKIGGQARLRSKSAAEYDETDKIGAATLATEGVPAITNFYDNGYTNGPGVNTVLTAQLAAAQGNPPQFNNTAYFNATENVYAGYAQYETKVGPWQALAGVRIEATEGTYGGYVPVGVIGSGDYNFTIRNKDYVNAFPTVQLRYNFSKDFLVRATYSTGISRPGFEQNTVATTDNGDGTFTSGNPNLKPTTGQNFDLSFEYYLPQGGVLQFGLFDKEFRNYIVTNSETVNSPTNGIEYFTSFSNINYAFARGGEIAYHQKFLWLPSVFKGLGIDANLTMVDSKFREYDAQEDSTGHAEYGLLPGTSRTSWNLAGFYEAYGFEARIAAEFVSKELFNLSGFAGSATAFDLGDAGTPSSKEYDTIQDDRLSVDFTASYKITHNWKVYFAAKNLTDAPLRFYIDNPSFPIQREYYEQTFLFGVKAHF